jgi:glycosyltransferase involved in cell wall biosynthesis
VVPLIDAMKLAILGTRGVPARYGGFETFAAELGRRLVQRGHEVTVYCREHDTAQWAGIRRIELPAAGGKYFETVSHSALSALDALGRGYDAVLVCNAANAFVLPLLRAAKIPVAINVDGIERRRRKWNLVGKAVYAAGESLSVVFANRIVADAEVIAEYYRETFGARPVMIPYGSEFPEEPDSDVLARLGLTAEGYVLYVSRFEPENNPLEVLQAYRKLKTDVPLVMLGEARYDKSLGDALHEQAVGNIVLAGAVYGADYRTLQRHARLYIQATEVGGTHPALIEAMASGGCVLAHDTPENREVGGDAVGYFTLRPTETLSAELAHWLADPPLRERMRARARERAAALYSWETVTSAYETLFSALRR